MLGSSSDDSNSLTYLRDQDSGFLKGPLAAGICFYREGLSVTQQDFRGPVVTAYLTAFRAVRRGGDAGAENALAGSLAQVLGPVSAGRILQLPPLELRV